MAYFLGRDVKVWITTEDADTGIKSDGTACDAVDSAPGTDFFANERAAASTADTYALTDITGVDLGIGVTDEDVTYIGQRSVLKAEIKKETTVSLTRKKSSSEWDIIFNGPTASGNTGPVGGELTHGARWGCHSNLVSDGLTSPKDHRPSAGTGDYTFGYRVYIQLKDAVESIAVPMCQITGHTVSISADGASEETMEFSSNVTPIIATDANAAAAVLTVPLADI
tara:strand:+ start:28 stop:702 length:675 start_codon:yes stop_codon:yes gene_type:complete